MVKRILTHYDVLQVSQLLQVDPDGRCLINMNSSFVYYYVLKAVILFDPDPVIERILLPSPVQRKDRRSITAYVVDHLKANFAINGLPNLL